MKILVIGAGGREHAIAWKLAQSPRISTIFVAPGNAGSALETMLQNVPLNTIEQYLDFVRQKKIAFTVVGPEQPLSEGIVDAFRREGLMIFGPTQYAAQLESSKHFAKRFMQQQNIPTAHYQCFEDSHAAHAYLDTQTLPVVIKADGLAAGKGVIIVHDQTEAHVAIDSLFSQQAPGMKLLIEDYVDGEEASFIVMADGEHSLALATSQDHKRLYDNDTGPNTGGMGAYSPAPVITPEIHAKIMREVIEPCLQGMRAQGHPYTGFLYAGLMISPHGDIKVLEFNCRLGDPEAQVLLLRLKSDLVTLLEHALQGKLHQIQAQWDRRAALGVVLAAANYPQSPHTGQVITGLQKTYEHGHVFHAGTCMNAEGAICSCGGRVLCVTALGDNIKIAQQRAYQYVESICFAGMHYRRDIGYRALNRIYSSVSSASKHMVDSA